MKRDTYKRLRFIAYVAIGTMALLYIGIAIVFERYHEVQLELLLRGAEWRDD